MSFGFITAIDRFRAPVLLSLHELLFCISHVYGTQHDIKMSNVRFGSKAAGRIAMTNGWLSTAS